MLTQGKIRPKIDLDAGETMSKAKRGHPVDIEVAVLERQREAKKEKSKSV
jgi:hypothetical protein